MARVVLDHPDPDLLRRIDAAVAAGRAASREQFVERAVFAALDAGEARRIKGSGRRTAAQASEVAAESESTGSTASPSEE